MRSSTHLGCSMISTSSCYTHRDTAPDCYSASRSGNTRLTTLMQRSSVVETCRVVIPKAILTKFSWSVRVSDPGLRVAECNDCLDADGGVEV